MAATPPPMPPVSVRLSETPHPYSREKQFVVGYRFRLMSLKEFLKEGRRFMHQDTREIWAQEYDRRTLLRPAMPTQSKVQANELLRAV